MTRAAPPNSIRKIAHDARGVRYEIDVGLDTVQVVVSFHALSRARRWHVDLDNVLGTLVAPEEVLRGHHGRFIAHRRDDSRLVRVVYEYDGRAPFVVTVYRPSAARYFEGKNTHEDHVLSRR